MRLGHTATITELKAANKADIHIICPPPQPIVGVSYQAVLAWDLSTQMELNTVESSDQLASMVRRCRDLPRRPIMGSPDNSLFGYGRQLDIVLHSRQSLGTDFSMREHAQWLAQRRQLTRPGVAQWATIRTDPIVGLLKQWRAFGVLLPDESLVSLREMQQVAYTAIRCGMRGVYYSSHGPLDANTKG